MADAQIDFDLKQAQIEDLCRQVAGMAHQLAESRARCRAYESFIQSNADKLGMSVDPGVEVPSGATPSQPPAEHPG